MGKTLFEEEGKEDAKKKSGKVVRLLILPRWRGERGT